MKTCCLVWEIPVIEGEHYNPIINVIYHKLVDCLEKCLIYGHIRRVAD
jgi:hypothetical protein